ncbi:MAG: nucleotidyltransferase [Planctomycetes bacterium]|nr:nucleotidyltransferase [Planctomycetota bacterium]MBI3847254.1 nucleotidyltransferase [Planctomycetota bacterium]
MMNPLRPLFESLNSHRVDYLVIGGVAAIAYGVPRVTLDTDILIRPTRSNAAALLKAFEAAGLATSILTTPDELAAQEITIFKDRVRVDVQTRTPGIDFDAAFARRKTIDLDGVPVHLVAVEDLIASKKAAGRPRDLEDVRILESRRQTP